MSETASIDRWLQDKIAEAFAKDLDDQFMNGFYSPHKNIYCRCAMSNYKPLPFGTSCVMPFMYAIPTDRPQYVIELEKLLGRFDVEFKSNEKEIVYEISVQ